MTIRAKSSSSKTLLLLPILLAVLCIFFLPHILTLTDPTSTSSPSTPSRALPPQRTISNLLHSQNLSHGAFHNAFTKQYLADLVSRHHKHPKSAVIIGLAFGGEANKLTEYDVHAIEPMPRFIENFRKNGAPHITLHPFAAAKEPGMMKVSYGGSTVVVNKTRGDAVLPEGMSPSVVSADTQGSEYDALQGLGEILQRAGSVWVEVGCRNSTEEMLNWLDERFVLFDFVPWGEKKGVEEAFAIQQFAVGERPEGNKEWVEWLCERRQEFKWLQTDVVGVRRDIVRECWSGLENVARECCKEDCKLREATLE